MTTLTGTLTLTRLAWRLDRVRLTVWVLILGLVPALTAAQYKQLYPTPQALAQVSGIIRNPSLVAINGPLFAGNSIGALTAWKIMATELILVALMAVFTVIRHSRTEEETGRLELLGAQVLGRYAPLTAALATAWLASLAAGILAAIGLVETRQPVTGSIAMGAAIAVIGLIFASIAGAAAQLTESGRTAIAIATGVLGAAYLLRAVGDTGPAWATWASPVGWGMRVRPYAHERWWLIALALAVAAVMAAVAYTLNDRRDLGFGMLAQRPGPAEGPGLGGPFVLAWRLHRGLLLGWAAGMAVWGAVLGGAADGIAKAKIDNTQLSEMLTRLGGGHAVVNAYLAAVLGITGLIAAAYTVQATLRLHGEESAGRLEPILATTVGRIRWAFSHLFFAVVGTAVLLADAGVMAGLAYGGRTHDISRQTGHLVTGALAQAPAAWILAGLGVALFGFAPRWTGLAWVGLIACVLVLEVGEVLGLSQWVVDVSPFAHVPKVPSAQFTSAPLIWLALIATALAGAGLAAFRRRDVA